MALPISDPVLIFALAMVIFVGAPLLFERLRVPGIIGLIVAGAVVGPNGLNLLERGATIVLLGTVGLLYLRFMIGLELDLHEFNRYRNRSLVFGSLSFLIRSWSEPGWACCTATPSRPVSSSGPCSPLTRSWRTRSPAVSAS